MRPSDILKFCGGKWGGKYALEGCGRKDCCPGSPGHHKYVYGPDGMKSVPATDHPRCGVISGPH